VPAREVDVIFELDAELPDSGAACARGVQHPVDAATGPIRRDAPEDLNAPRKLSSLEFFPSSLRQEEKTITAAGAKKPAVAPIAAPTLWPFDIGPPTSAGRAQAQARPSHSQCCI
jgi:hypothetical protein